MSLVRIKLQRRRDAEESNKCDIPRFQISVGEIAAGVSAHKFFFNLCVFASLWFNYLR